MEWLHVFMPWKSTDWKQSKEGCMRRDALVCRRHIPRTSSWTYQLCLMKWTLYMSNRKQNANKGLRWPKKRNPLGIPQLKEDKIQPSISVKLSGYLRQQFFWLLWAWWKCLCERCKPMTTSQCFCWNCCQWRHFY